MNAITYRPTKLIIKENALNKLVQNYDNPYYSMAADYMDVVVSTESSKPKNLFERIAKFFTTKSRLKVVLDHDSKNGFWVNACRSVNSLAFDGKAVPLDLEKVAKEPEYFNNILLKAKESVLKDIAGLNKVKKNWILPRIR